MAFDQFIRNFQWPSEEFFDHLNLAAGEVQQLCIGEIEWRGITDDEAVAQPILGEGSARAVGDFAARCRNVQDIGSGQFLGFVGRNDGFFKRLRAWAGPYFDLRVAVPYWKNAVEKNEEKRKSPAQVSRNHLMQRNEWRLLFF